MNRVLVVLIIKYLFILFPLLFDKICISFHQLTIVNFYFLFFYLELTDNNFIYVLTMYCLLYDYFHILMELYFNWINEK
jgi:hypothetical protein